jgi:hypothetical protein
VYSEEPKISQQGDNEQWRSDDVIVISDDESLD